MSQFCTEKGGWLAEIFSSEEQTSIMNEVIEGNNHYWIGLTDSATEGHFIWQHSSKPLSFSNWGPANPNYHGGKEDCVELVPTSNGQWNDGDCGHTKNQNALCEYRR